MLRYAIIDYASINMIAKYYWVGIRITINYINRGLILPLSDLPYNTSHNTLFGGDPVLYRRSFRFPGHQEVYINYPALAITSIIIPAAQVIKFGNQSAALPTRCICVLESYAV